MGPWGGGAVSGEQPPGLGLNPPTRDSEKLSSLWCISFLTCKVGITVARASQGPRGDEAGRAGEVLPSQCSPRSCSRWPGQARAARGVQGPRGPLRGAEGLGFTYQLPPTQADVPSNVAAGLRSLGIAEGAGELGVGAGQSP